MPHIPPSFRIRHAVIAVVLPLGIWLATVGFMSFEPAAGSISTASGSATFRDRCGACHILEKGITTHHGPNLYGIGREAGRRKPDLSAAEYILESILDPEAFVAPHNHRGMPKNVVRDLSADDIRDIVAFLASRGAKPDYDEIRRLVIPEQPAPTVRTIRRQDMELGEHVVRERGGCLQCHSLYRNAEYQVFAPGLFGVGLVDEQLVRESIVDPSKVVSPVHKSVNVFLESGKVVAGTLISQTNHRLVLLSRNEKNDPIRVEVPLSDIEREDGQPLILRSEISPMPSGLDKLLTPEELEAVISMIGQLN